MKRSLLIGVGAALIALVAIGGVALAGPALSRQPGAVLAAAAPTAAPGAPKPNGAGAHRAGAARLARLLIGATADAAGIQAKDVMQDLRAGKSLAQVAQAHGKTSDDVIKAARAKLQDQLKQAVASGRATQNRADAALAQFDQRAPALMNDANLARQIRRAVVGRRGGAAALVKATADVTGLQPKDVTQELRAGKSLAQIAQEHGKTADDILAKLREQGNQRLEQMLSRAKDLINQPGLGAKGKPAIQPAATPQT